MGAFSYKCFLKIKLRGAFKMKKTLKKISAASLVAFLFITLVACGGGNKTAATSESEATIESTVETIEGSSEEVSETVESTEEPDDIYQVDGPGVLAGSEFERALNKYDLFITKIERSDKFIYLEARRELESLGGSEILTIDISDEDMTVALTTLYYTRDTGSVEEFRSSHLGHVKVGDTDYWGFLEEKASGIGAVINKWRYDGIGEYSLDANRTGYLQNGQSILYRTLIDYQVRDNITYLNQIIGESLIIKAVSIDDTRNELQLYTDMGGFVIFDIITGEVRDGDNNHIAFGYRDAGPLGFDVLRFDSVEMDKVIESIEALGPEPETPTLF